RRDARFLRAGAFLRVVFFFAAGRLRLVVTRTQPLRETVSDINSCSLEKRVRQHFSCADFRLSSASGSLAATSIPIIAAKCLLWCRGVSEVNRGADPRGGRAPRRAAAAG